jgi:hypothetical protein
MPTGSYNVSKLLGQLGHKNQIEMPVSKNIQVTLPLESMSGQLPVHNYGSVMLGMQTGAVSGEFGMLAIQSLDPGGFVVEQIYNPSNVKFYIHVQDAAPVFVTTGPLSCSPQNFSSEPSVSIGTYGTTATQNNTGVPQFYTRPILNGTFAPLIVPRGKWLLLGSGSANTVVACMVQGCGIGATQSEE